MGGKVTTDTQPTGLFDNLVTNEEYILAVHGVLTRRRNNLSLNCSPLFGWDLRFDPDQAREGHLMDVLAIVVAITYAIPKLFAGYIDFSLELIAVEVGNSVHEELTKELRDLFSEIVAITAEFAAQNPALQDQPTHSIDYLTLPKDNNPIWRILPRIAALRFRAVLK